MIFLVMMFQKNPNRKYNYLTIAENGNTTPIYIYKYPEMKTMSVCRNGANWAYTFVNYSQDGELMVSQGDAPDHSITIWKWADAQIILKCANEFDNRALTVAFSAFNSEFLVSAGIGHIKFWAICRTFTGLKLKCTRGRFEKRDVSDILAACVLPDGRVLSGCQWGNMLLWQGGYVEFEVLRKTNCPCHAAPIAQILLTQNRYVWTMGHDGYVRIWSWEAIEMATPYEENGIAYAEVDPLYEYRIGDVEDACHLLSIVHDVDDIWYAQDANNGIWRLEIGPKRKSMASKLLFRCHGGEVIGLGVSSMSNHLATLGVNGSLHVYDYITSQLLVHHKFAGEGRDLLWLPRTVGNKYVARLLRIQMHWLEFSDCISWKCASYRFQ